MNSNRGRWRSTLLMSLAVGLVSLIFVFACKTSLQEFRCSTNAECNATNVSGECAEDGHCTFADSECDSNRRYGESSGGLSGLCTQGDVLDGGQSDDSGNLDLPDAGTQGNIVALSLGTYHSCVLLDGNKSVCWGDNSDGQLNGNPFAAHDGSPIVRQTMRDVKATGINAGVRSTCVYGTNGAECFGGNPDLEFGDEFSSDVNVHEMKIGKLADDSRTTNCALAKLGLSNTFNVYCWGDNSNGQASGDGDSDDDIVPLNLNSFLHNNVSTMAVGRKHACVLDISNGDVELECWGGNQFSQLTGNPSGANRAFPIRGIIVSDTPKSIEAGEDHTCMLSTEGRVYCWGKNIYGESNPFSPGETTTVPTDVAPTVAGSYAAGLALGSNHSCMLGSGDRVYCWGDDTYGQLGSSQFGQPVPGLENVQSIFAGTDHTCALVRLDGVHEVFCWGRNDHHQVDTSSTDFYKTPVRAFRESL